MDKYEEDSFSQNEASDTEGFTQEINFNKSYAIPLITEMPNEVVHKKPNFFKKHWLTIVLVLIILGVTSFATVQTLFMMDYHTIALNNKKQYESENLRVKSLETELSKTEEGKKSLEKVNENLKTENTALDTKVVSIEAQYNTAKKDLESKLTELNNAKSQLTNLNSQMSTINKDLEAKRAEVSKLNNGIAKFAEVEVLIGKFEQANIDYITNIDACIVNINFYMESENESYLDKANEFLSNAREQYTIMDESSDKMKAIFDLIKSGNY